MAASEPGLVISARELSRRFGAHLAVDRVSLNVERGEVVGFLGPNGAGKSTLLRMLVGLLTPTAGMAEVLGHQLPRDAEALKPKVGYMAQRFALYEDLSVEENLDFAAQIFGLELAARRSRLEDVLADFGLAERRAERAGSLSGGWKQRLALAAATIHRPELVLLDEPTAGVDPQQRRAFWGEIFELSSAGATVLVSTHYMDEAARCHRLLMMRRGRPVALGTPGELRQALASRVLEIACEPPEAALAVLNRLPETESVTQLGDLLHVLLTAEAAPAERVISRLRAALEGEGLRPTQIAPTTPNLEDVFVAASRGDGDQTTMWGPEGRG